MLTIALDPINHIFDLLKYRLHFGDGKSTLNMVTLIGDALSLSLIMSYSCRLYLVKLPDIFASWHSAGLLLNIFTYCPHNAPGNLQNLFFLLGISWKRYFQLTVCTRDRQIVSIERVYTPSTFYMKSAVS